ncbi:MAG: hydantoinase/oxoprolinase family protein [Solirubrobacterales bacterium]
MKLLGIDVGGTFTDFILHDTETLESWVLKISSGEDTAATIAGGTEEITAKAGCAPADIGLLIHGTTVATNAILEFNGATVGMITTEGFRDVTHIGRHQRPMSYSIRQEIPWQARPLVRRRHRRPVPQRMVPPSGEVVEELDREAVANAARELAAEGVDSVAICFLFSYLNPDHEDEAAAIVRKVMPDAFVCTSSGVVPQFREFERFTTTAVNAFVGPDTRSYIGRLDDRLREIGAEDVLYVMQSNGGTAKPEAAMERPVTLLLSGPVGGVMGGIWASGGDKQYLATLDVGGTSADIGIVAERGLVEARSRDTWIAGYPIMVPMIDIETIGAGGGSVAYVDEAGGLHVGPRSAGARPGPAAYGRGGTEPTVTDANVVLGRLPSELAGGLELRPDLAEQAVGAVAEKLGLGLLETAAGIIRVVNESMAAALRTKTIERGLDPRDFLLAGFGGGGPLQTAEVARLLGITRVLIPEHPGVTSASGLLTTDLRYDVTQSYLQPLAGVDPEELGRRYEAEEEVMRERLREDGIADEDITIEWAADLRYQGQSYELKVPLQSRRIDAETIAGLSEDFHETHRKEFGHAFTDMGIAFVNLRLTGTGRLPRLSAPTVSGGSVEEAHVGDTSASFDSGDGVSTVDVSVYAHEKLPVGERVPGPAIVTQVDSTTLVPPDCTVERDPSNNLVIEIPPAAGASA